MLPVVWLSSSSNSSRLLERCSPLRPRTNLFVSVNGGFQWKQARTNHADMDKAGSQQLSEVAEHGEYGHGGV